MILTLAVADGLTTLDQIVIVMYLGAMLYMGLTIGRQQSSTEDFFIGGRNLPAWAVGISLFASLLSTITYLGMPGEMFRTGIAFLTRELPTPLVLLVVWFAWIPFFMRLNLTSAYEYLERRFNYTTRAVAAVFCLCLLFGWMAVVVLTASAAMVEIAALDLSWFFGTNGRRFADADMQFMIVAIGLCSAVYTTMGGMRAVVWTDVIQFFVLMAGAFFTIGFIAWKTSSGPMDWIELQQNYRHETVQWFDWDVRNRSTVFTISIGMLFWFVCTHGANQVALQRYFSTKDVSAARRSYVVNALASICIALCLACVGIALMYFIGRFELPASQTIAELSQIPRGELSVEQLARFNQATDAVFPQFIRSHLPIGLRGMVVAALFAAAMSSIDSGANSISTILTVDFVRRWKKGEKRSTTSEAMELRYARFFTAAFGVVMVFVSLALYHASKGSDIITLCQKGFNCFLGPLGGLFFLGMFSRRATARSVLPALFVGEAVGIALSYSREFFGVAFSTHLVIPAAWLATVVSCLVFAGLVKAKPHDEIEQWLWWSVVRSGR